MSKAPPIPREQRAFQGQKPDVEGHPSHDDVQSPDPGNADVNLAEQGRHGNLAQNTSRSGNVRDR